MIRIKLILSLAFFIIGSILYSQKGFSVDKDYRIKRYQKEMIQFLIDNNQFGVKTNTKETSLISNYSNVTGISKCIEVFQNQPEFDILLVRFYSFASGADNFWGILESNNKYLFYYNEKDLSELTDYLKKYDIKAQKILLDYLKIYTSWNGPNLHSPQIIEENSMK